MAISKKITTLFVAFFTTALLLGLTNRYLAREMGKSHLPVRTLSADDNSSLGQPKVRRPSVSVAYRPVLIDAHHDPLAPMDPPKRDTPAGKSVRGDRPIHEPSQDDPNILLQ